MTIGTASELTAVLDSWVAQGIVEKPLGSNKTPIGEEFGWNGVAWCAETMSVAQTRIGAHCFHEAAVVRCVALAKQRVNGLEWIPANGVIREGDMSCFQWGDGSHHISYVRNPGTQVKFQTDGGNEHDRMYRQWRDRKYVMGFIRLPYGADHIQPAPSHPEDEMLTSEEHDMLTRIDNRTANLEAVANRDIDTLKPLIEQVIQMVKDDPTSGAGPGDVDGADFVEALKEALVKGTAA